jgi:hypothetical protein
MKNLTLLLLFVFSVPAFAANHEAEDVPEVCQQAATAKIKNALASGSNCRELSFYHSGTDNRAWNPFAYYWYQAVLECTTPDGENVRIRLQAQTQYNKFKSTCI